MAVYHLHVHSGTKASGKGAGGKARYVLREGPYAQGRERVVEGSLAREVETDKAAELVHAESGNLPAWAVADPIPFWDASDRYERANGCTYREVEVALPEELSLKDQIALASAFAREIAKVSEGVTPYTLAMHSQDPAHPDRRHAHILVSDRVFDGQDRTPETFFKRYNGKEPGKGGARKTEDRRAKPDGTWTDRIRPLWQDLANRALERAGLAVRIDHRPLEEQRREVERQAAQEQDLQKRRSLAERAAALDRPAQPKKGRVLTHAGPEKAPERAALVIAYEQSKAERQEALEARRAAEREAERVAEELTRKQQILTAQQQRQERRNAQAIQGRWNIRRNDRATAAEQRPGIRYPEREHWQAYRERILTEAYNRDLAQALGRWVKVERKPEGLHIHNRQMDLLDHGDRVTAGMGGTDREIAAMLDIARAKGWQRLDITGSPDFREKLGRAALDAGFTLADTDLQARIQERQRQEAATQEAMLRKQAPILGDWIQAHPKRSALLKAAGRWLPGAPTGVEDWSEKAWEAAEAWRMGRHGTAEERKRLQAEGTQLQRDCVGDGLEVAKHAWAQKGLGLRIGAEAPAAVPGGLSWYPKGEMTRKRIEGLAQTIQDRKTHYGVSHPLVVTFGPFVPEAKRVLVYEQLLRSGLEVQKPNADWDRKPYETAQERLRTHNADGTEQPWVIDKRKREAQAAKEKAEREAKKAEQERQREAQQKREADRKKLKEDTKALGREVGRYGKSEERNRRAAGLLAEAKRLEVTDLNKDYAEGAREGRKEAALDACRKAGAAIQYAHGGREEQPACDEKTWAAVQKQAREAIAAAEQLGIPKEEAEGALYAGRDAVVREQRRELQRGMGGPGF